MANIGEMLKQARLDKGITLEQAEEETKIRSRYLAALENGNYGIIPGQAYITGFLKIYAGFLGLDTNEVMLGYKSSVVEEPLDKTPEKAPVKARKYPGPGKINRKKKNSSWSKYLLTGILTVAAIATLVFFNDWNNDRIAEKGDEKAPGQIEQTDKPDQDEGDKTDPAKPDNNGGRADNNGGNQVSNNGSQINNGGERNNNGTPGNNQVQPQDPGAVVNDGVHVVLKVKEQNSWIQVVADNQTVFTGTLTPGQEKAFDARENIRLVLGNAGAVEVTHNGRNLGILGSMNEVVRENFGKSM